MRLLTTTLLGLGLTLAATGCGRTHDPKQDNAASPAPQTVSAEEKQKLDEQYAALPEAAIVRVPVDESGATIGAPEMKVAQNGAALDSADNTAAAFDNGTAPEKLITSTDELDTETSTQSWTAYDNYNNSGYNTGTGGGYNTGTGGGYNNGTGGGYNTGTGGGYNNGTGGGYNNGTGGGYNNGTGGTYNNGGVGCGSYCGGWGHDYWYNNYKPVLYYGHNNWSYGNDRPSYYHQGGYRYYCYRPYRWW